MSGRKAELLEKAKQVVSSVMQTEGAELLFNSPVDPIALKLHDYYDIITEPIDLGTIKNRLVDGKNSNWKTSYYQTPFQVFRDVRLVWTNCYNFNNGENDEPVRELCRKTEEYFNAKWKAAKLPTNEVHGEEDVSSDYSLLKTSVELPIRFLDDFAILSTQSSGYFPLGSIQASTVLSIYVTGNLLPIEESSTVINESFPVYLDHIVDWCFQYGELPGIWIVTKEAWYKLLNPAESYVPFLSKTIIKFMTTIAHLNFEVQEIPSCFKRFSNGLLEDESGQFPDDLVAILMENDSVREGTLSLMKKRSRSPSNLSNSIEKKKCPVNTHHHQRSTKNTELNEISPLIDDSGAYSSIQEGDSEDALVNVLEGGGSLRRCSNKMENKHKSKYRNQWEVAEEVSVSLRKHSRRKKHEKRSLKVKLGGSNRRKLQNLNEASLGSELEDDDPLFDPTIDTDSFLKEDDEDDDYINEHKKSKTKKPNESESQKLKRERKALELSKIEKEADRRRGSPPNLRSDFRIPQKLIGIALSCWDFFMTFRLILELPQFPFWRFEAAICPSKSRKKPTSHRSQLSLRDPHHSDSEAAASGLLLHDIHTSLARVLQGKIQLTKETPTFASLESVKPSTGPWTQTISLLLLKSPLEDIDEDTRKLASFLHSHEYLDLTISAKLKILTTLINMVLALEAFHDYLNTLIDKQSIQRMQQGYETKALNQDILESLDLTSEQKAIRLSIEKWTHWFGSFRLGIMNTIGQDYRGAQYWILGASSGCYRIYVEQRLTYSHQCCSEGIEKEPEVLGKLKGKGKVDSGLIWGYYEGEKISELVDWLIAGDLESEKALLDALQNLPKPVRIEEQDNLEEQEDEEQDNLEEQEELINHHHKTMKIISESYLHLHPSTLQKFKLDDYQLIKYPLLRGEGELLESLGDIQLYSRILVFIKSVLGSIQFWKPENEEIRNRIVKVINRIEESLGIADFVKEISKAFDLFFEFGRFRESWNQFHSDWIRSLLNCASYDKIINYLVVFQSYLLFPAQSIPRTSFNSMIHEVRCPLYFPRTGDSIVVLKTGCLAHLDHYLEVSRRTLESPITVDCFRNSMHPQTIEEVKREAEKLNPFEQFRVCCIAYRSPYPDPPPEDTPFFEDLGIPVLPCMWMLLSPENVQKTSFASIALPIHVDNSLPDFIVKVDAFEQSIQKNWQVGDRFKMFFGGKSTARSHAGGGYYKGTISAVTTKASLGDSYDPWESLTVQWDNDNTGASMKVSPWEIEVDPEEQRKLEEARQKQLESQARYSRALGKQQRTEFYTEMMDGDEDVRSITDPDYDPLIDYEGDPHRGSRSRKRGSALDELVYYDPKNPSGPVPSEMMSILPGSRGFPILIHNFMQRLKGKFKCPVFSGKDLDLFKVFHEVQNRGGYDRVTNLKLWKEVCRTLDVNLKGQTSASYNMRLNYEKCLLDFEHYLSSGTFNQELENGCAPSSTDLEPFPMKMRSEMLNAEEGTSVRNGGTVKPPFEELEQQMVTRGSRRNRTVLGNESMTRLLLEDESNSEFPASFSDKSPETILEDRKPDWARLVSPLGDHGRTLMKGKSPLGWISAPSLSPVVQGGEVKDFRRSGCIVEVQLGESIGVAMDRMGWALLGTTVWRRFPDLGHWYKAQIINYNPRTSEFCLLSHPGTDQESTEWIDLRELQSDELSQVDPEIDQRSAPKEQIVVSAPLKSPVPGGRADLSNLLTSPPALHRFGAEESSRFQSDRPFLPLLSPSQDRGISTHSNVTSMDLISKVLSSGMNPELFKQLMDSEQHPASGIGGNLDSLMNSSTSQAPNGPVSATENPHLRDLGSDLKFPKNFRK